MLKNSSLKLLEWLACFVVIIAYKPNECRTYSGNYFSIQTSLNPNTYYTEGKSGLQH